MNRLFPTATTIEIMCDADFRTINTTAQSFAGGMMIQDFIDVEEYPV